ncbi:cyclic pyranopterin monophosphate synthase MoaC [Nibricoccus sp. IMCC34717]|uniref:cyclic pyranopterin monophosphate synthase MoaC n=1 Tax=Nibricoccus sp. IMCC34717 TaxID=3034021 RepID=UPI00384FEAA4
MLSHLNAQNQPQMVDVGDKAPTSRRATAIAEVRLPPALAALVSNNEIHGKKGPLFQTASLAGIMGAKRTSELIPLCHPLPLEDVKVVLEAGLPDTSGWACVEIRCTARTFGKTGVEMEALTGATVAALTLYDMGKAVSPEIEIRSVRLLEKSGGKRDFNAAS